MDRGPNPGLGLAILRVVVGVTFIAHGLPKLADMPATVTFFDSLGIPLPALAAWLIALFEVGGGLLLIVGFLVTPVSLLFAAQSLVGIIVFHAENGFYVVEFGEGGVELSLLLIASLLMLVLGGPGVGSVDGRRRREAIAA